MEKHFGPINVVKADQFLFSDATRCNPDLRLWDTRNGYPCPWSIYGEDGCYRSDESKLINDTPQDKSWGYIDTLEGRKHVAEGDWILTVEATGRHGYLLRKECPTVDMYLGEWDEADAPPEQPH